MKKVIVGLVMTAVLSNVVLAAEFESMNVTGNESVQSVDMNNDMLFMNVDGEVMTLEEMEAIEGEGFIGAILVAAFEFYMARRNDLHISWQDAINIVMGALFGFAVIPI